MQGLDVGAQDYESVHTELRRGGGGGDRPETAPAG